MPFEAMVKVEVRGGPKSSKAQSKKASVIGHTITWDERLILEVAEEANELRIMLCRERYQGNKRGTSVIAACGIYVADILEAVPIDKYFELFKPNAGGEGGHIRIAMNFVQSLDELDAVGQMQDKSLATDLAVPVANKANEHAAGTKDRSLPSKPSGKRRRFPFIPLLVIIGAGGFVAKKLLNK